MAKAALKEAEASQEVTTTQDAGLPAELMGDWEAHPAEGISTAMEDRKVPFLAIVQSGSPQVKRGHERYIPEIKIGDIILPSIGRWWSGETGIRFVQAHFSKAVVEWVPREDGGGPVGSHPTMPKDARRVPHPENPKRTRIVSPAGNDYVPTAYHFGFILNGEDVLGGEPLGVIQAVFSLSSSGLGFSSNWVNLQNYVKLPSGAIAPGRARVWKITTTNRSKGGFDWSVFVPEDMGWQRDKTINDAAIQMYESIKSGALRAEQGDRGTDSEEVDGEPPF